MMFCHFFSHQSLSMAVFRQEDVRFLVMWGRTEAGRAGDGEEKAVGRSWSSFQGLKGFQESWKGTWDNGLE